MRVWLATVMLLLLGAQCKLLDVRIQLNSDCQMVKTPRISRDSKLALTACEGNVTVFDLEKGKELQQIYIGSKDQVSALSLAANSSTIVVGVKNCQLQIWSRSNVTGLFERTFNETVGNLLEMFTAQLSLDESVIYVGGLISVLVYDFQAKRIKTIISNETAGLDFIQSAKHNSVVYFGYKIFAGTTQLLAVNCSLPDYKAQEPVLFTGADKMRVRSSNLEDRISLTLTTKGFASIFDSDLKTEVGRIEGHDNSVSWAQWSWNDRYMFTVSADQKLIVWDARTYLEKERYDLGYDGISVTLSCNSKYVLVCGFYTTTIFNVADPSLLGNCEDVGREAPKEEPAQLSATAVVLAVLLFGCVLAESILGSARGQPTLLAIQSVSFLAWLFAISNHSENLLLLNTAFSFSYLRFGRVAPTSLGLLANASQCCIAFIIASCLFGIVAVLKLKFDYRPLAIFGTCCKRLLSALTYPMLFFLQSNQLKVAEMVSSTTDERVMIIFAFGAILLLMFLQLLTRQAPVFFIKLTRLAYVVSACLLLTTSSIDNKLPLKMGLLYLLFVTINCYGQFKQPDGPGLALSKKLSLLQGVIEVAALISTSINHSLSTVLLALLSCVIAIANPLILRRAQHSVKKMAQMVQTSTRTDKLEDSNVQFENRS